MSSSPPGDGIPTVFVAVAGRSNGLGPVMSGNTAYPVVNCPPLSADWGTQDVWSSLRLPSGKMIFNSSSCCDLALVFCWCCSTIHTQGKALEKQLDQYQAKSVELCHTSFDILMAESPIDRAKVA